MVDSKVKLLVVIVDVTDPMKIKMLRPDNNLFKPSTNTVLHSHKNFKKSRQQDLPTAKIHQSHLPKTSKANYFSIQTCPLCFKDFSSPSLFVKHAVKFHLYFDSGFFCCPYCIYSSRHKPSMLSHIQIHTLDKPFTCELCSKTFKQKIGLLQHIKSHSKAKRFSCSKCQSRFKTACSLSSHKEKTHDQLKPFVCMVCKMQFGYATNLRIHLRTHTGERPFKCDVCLKSFIQQGHLSAHKRLHSGEKTFKCQYCEALFTHLGNLHQHEITQHTKSYKHRCDQCSKGFIGPGELKRHFLSAHALTNDASLVLAPSH